jgi:hypothetical protein
MDPREIREKEEMNRTGGSIIVEVACDDRFTKLSVDGHETLAEVRRKALEEMGIVAANPDEYIVIGPGRRRIDDQATIDQLVKQGERLAFRFLRAPRFGRS